MRLLPALAVLALALGAGRSVVHARELPPSSGTVHTSAMPGMGMPAHVHGGASQQRSMPELQTAPTPMQHPREPMPHMRTGAMPGHAMGRMQGGGPPLDARDPDYSDGIAPAPMDGTGMAMEGGTQRVALRIDRLEAFHGAEGNGQHWDIAGGYGDNLDRLWLRTEGDRTSGRTGAGDVEVLWQDAITAFADSRLGLRTDLGAGPPRHWIAFGVQGLAPYGFELEATGYVGAAGRTAARLRADYDMRLTRHLVLQPELELNAYGKADPARGLGSGLADASLGLRLRYEFRRDVAPYAGWACSRRFGGTAGHARAGAEAPLERRWVAGVRIRF
jgi:copper resistance protein B